jgi:hypothetical protein
VRVRLALIGGEQIFNRDRIFWSNRHGEFLLKVRFKAKKRAAGAQ